MRRRFALAAVLLPLLAACSPDSTPVAPPATGTTAAPPPASRTIVPGSCATPAELLALVETAFGAGSPNYNSARGKTENLIKQVEDGNYGAAQAQAYNIIGFVLATWRDKGLPGAEADVLALINAVSCYAGLSTTATDADNSWLVFPSDSEQVLISSDLRAGLKLGTSPVAEPTLFTIAAIDPSQYPQPGSGPLETKLDQYPGFYDFDKQSATDAPLTRPVIVAICLGTSVDDVVESRLRLGHQRQPGPANFEITPAVEASELDFLNCPDPASTASALPEWLQKAVAFVMPRPLYASSALLLAGGVGGTANELSPFGPVDTQLSASGGVGGSANELQKNPWWLRGAPSSLSSSATSSMLEPVCSAIEAPIGTPVAPDCRPRMTITTHLGTPLEGVPVQWTVIVGGGSVALPAGGLAASCGEFSPSVATATDASGSTSVCWTLGAAAGINQVRATPSAGGDAPPGVTFAPAATLFTATANPPVALVVDQQPTVAIAGTPLTLTVSARDENGVTVLGWNGSVSASLDGASFASGTTTINFSAGVATFGPLVIEEAGSHVVSFTATFPPLPPGADPLVATTATNPIAIGPAAAAAIRIVSGDGQTVAAGSPTPVAPVVGVRDAFGNDVPGVSITWVATLSSEASVAPATSTTGSNGQAQTTWTLGPDANQLVASITALPDSSVTFNATGIVSLSVVNSCPIGNSGDPFNDPAKPYGFWIPNPGNGKSVRQVTLYVSSAGKANASTQHLLALDTRVGAWNHTVQTTTSTVTLRGNNAESKPVTFTLPSPVIGSGNGGDVFFRLREGGLPSGVTLNFNTGPCPLGSCKPPAGCNAIEVTTFPSWSGTGPVPHGTTYRRSVAIVVKG